jgi:hypothetical protein
MKRSKTVKRQSFFAVTVLMQEGFPLHLGESISCLKPKFSASPFLNNNGTLYHRSG